MKDKYLAFDLYCLLYLFFFLLHGLISGYSFISKIISIIWIIIPIISGIMLFNLHKNLNIKKMLIIAIPGIFIIRIGCMYLLESNTMLFYSVFYRHFLGDYSTYDIVLPIIIEGLIFQYAFYTAQKTK